MVLSPSRTRSGQTACITKMRSAYGKSGAKIEIIYNITN